MKSHSIQKRFASASVLALVVGITGGASALADGGPQVIASGLNSPRQLSFSPGGSLYVAEAGTTGTHHCQPSPLGGTACIGLTGSVAKVGDRGKVTRVVTGLPSAGTPDEPLGPSDLTFTGRDTFALTIGLGGSLDYRAGFGRQGRLLGTIVSVDLHAKKWDWRDSKKHENTTPRVRLVADLAAFEGRANPDGEDIDSDPTGIARSGRGFVVTDSGGNSLVSTRRGGSTVAAFGPVLTTQPGPAGPPGFPADAVPTDVVKGPDGAWYVSELVGFPFEAGSSTIWRVVPGHAPRAWATGLTNVTSLAFARDGSLYAVQISSTGLLSGMIGSLVKVTPHASSHRTVAGGLNAPYGIAIRGHSAYVTTGSVSAGGGGVVKIRL